MSLGLGLNVYLSSVSSFTFKNDPFSNPFGLFVLILSLFVLLK